jgi:SNF2 family DNA or RNA helicase
MEALHRQALPFLLRRMKEDVLEDLPPKITQDYYCELSPLQEQLYEDFARSHAHQSLQETLAHGQAGTIQGNTHIFQVINLHSLHGTLLWRCICALQLAEGFNLSSTKTIPLNSKN